MRLKTKKTKRKSMKQNAVFFLKKKIDKLLKDRQGNKRKI